MTLQRLNWSQKNYDALNGFLAGVRPGELAVFDWDNTCIFGDIGEALFRHMALNLAFKIDAATLEGMIPDSVNGVASVIIRQRPLLLRQMKETIVAAYTELEAGAFRVSRLEARDCYRIFISGLLALNRAFEVTPGIGCAFAYSWVNGFLRGISMPEFAALAATVIEQELRAPIRRRSRCDTLHRWSYNWSSGIRLYPEMKALAKELANRGGKVVVSTASNQALVEKMIAVTGFTCQRIIGMALTIENGRFGPGLQAGLLPNLGSGKVANIRKQLEQEPALVAGDSDNDTEMLSSFPATRMRLIIQRSGGQKITVLTGKALAGEPGYLLQKTDHRLGKFAV